MHDHGLSNRGHQYVLGHRNANADIPNIVRSPRSKALDPSATVQAPSPLERHNRQQVANAAGCEGVGNEVTRQWFLDPAGRAACLVAPLFKQYVWPIGRAHLLIYRIGPPAFQRQHSIDAASLRPAILFDSYGGR